jgi:hypothetical protein
MGRFLPGCVHLWLTFETPARPGPQNSRGCKGVIRIRARPGRARLIPIFFYFRRPSLLMTC